MKHAYEHLLSMRSVVALSDEYPAGYIDSMHSHRRAQILYAASGVMSVSTPCTSFVIPPQRALWLPAETAHEVSCRGAVALRTLYVDPVLEGCPSDCRVFEVTDFLRALILEVATFEPDYDVDGREGGIVKLLLAETMAMPTAPFCARMPTDYRLVRVCKVILADPSDQRNLDDWASIAGMGRRTFTRTFRNETGMGLGMWRQQVRLMGALSMLSTGQSVTSVAFEVGYESASAFTAMFHRTFGAPPSHYVSRVLTH